MFLLVAEGFGLLHLLDYPFWGAIAKQFTHHPWNGLRFWDLVQPFFMFIVGVAMPFAFAKRWDRGESWGKVFRHVLKRSLILLLLGVGLHCGYNKRLVWELWNVLSQLSFTYLVAFLLMRKSVRTQILFTFSLILATELAYRFTAIPGFSEPFVQGKNFGSFMDMVLMGKINPQGWVAINCIPTTAHTMWGVLAGQLLKSNRTPLQKFKILAIAGILGVVVGFALDPITPIIKRICTSSFIICTGGWCLLFLSFFYWVVDIRGGGKWLHFITIVGMNSIFIYLFIESAEKWFNPFVGIFTLGTLGSFGVVGEIIHENVVIFLEWFLCYWLYKHKIFIKI